MALAIRFEDLIRSGEVACTLTPIAPTLIGDYFPKAQRNRAMQPVIAF